MRMCAQHRNTTNSNGNQVCRAFCRTQWESNSIVRYGGSAVDRRPTITNCSDDRCRHTLSVDHRRENHGSPRRHGVTRCRPPLPAAMLVFEFCEVLDDGGVVIVQLWFVMKLLLRCVPDPVFCVHFRVCDPKFGSQTNRPFWSQIPNTMSHVTNGSFLWHHLFCTRWQFVTRSRYKNNVHVWVFSRNKSG